MSSIGYNIYNSLNQQNTYRSLVAQVIELYGIPCRYTPKVLSTDKVQPFGQDTHLGDNDYIQSNEGLNDIFGEDIGVEYQNIIPFKMMIENIDAYDGMHNLFQKMGGYSQGDEITLQVEIETYRNTMKKYGYEMNKPQEGDLIFFDLALAKNGRPKIFEIKNCHENKQFFSFGELMVFEINCGLFQFSDEKLDTGDTNIDNLNTIANEEIDTKIGDNKTIETKADKIRDYHPNDIFGDPYSKD